VFGCLGRLGCLALVLLVAAGAWLTRDRWQPRLFGEQGATTVVWEPVTDSAARRAEQTVEPLTRGAGPGLVNLTAAELASLIAARAGVTGLPASVDSVQAAIDGERVMLRARINLDDIRGLDLGPLDGLMNRRERFLVTGTPAVVRPGLAEFRVESAQIGDLPVPRAMIPGLIRRLSRGTRPDSVAGNGIPFAVPDYVGDVRVARGRVTLYKTPQ
jgi:hypothetical protein